MWKLVFWMTLLKNWCFNVLVYNNAYFWYFLITPVAYRATICLRIWGYESTYCSSYLIFPLFYSFGSTVHLRIHKSAYIWMKTEKEVGKRMGKKMEKIQEFVSAECKHVFMSKNSCARLIAVFDFRLVPCRSLSLISSFFPQKIVLLPLFIVVSIFDGQRNARNAAHIIRT